jgi:hypothetical protein
MRTPTEYRKYAEDCRKLARQHPADKEALLKMAEAWEECAKNAAAAANQQRTGS